MTRSALRVPRRRLFGAVAAVVAVLALLLGAAPASAHASLVSSDPAEGEVLPEAPEVVTFTFTEPVVLSADSVQVFDAAGEDVESTAGTRDEVVTADLPDDLADGTYVVAWRVVSADGHPVTGSLTFSVGAPSETVVPPPVQEGSATGAETDLGVVQALQYVGLLLAGGLVFFSCWVVGAAGLPSRPRAAVRLLTRSGAALAVLAAALAVPLSVAYQQGLPFERVFNREALDPTLVGDDLLVLVLQVVGLAGALAATRRAVLSPRERVLATAGALLAVLSPAIVGHTRSYEPVPLLVVTDVVHLSAGAVWLGGLAGLALALPTLASRERGAAALLTRFSTLAAGVLVVLAATGSLMAWRVLGSWAGLVDTTYGRLLLVKVGVVLVVVALAGFNRFRLLPRVLGAAGHGDRTRATAGVRRVVLAEAGLLAVLLTVTGFLVNQSPREEAEAAAPAVPGVASGNLGDLEAVARVTPGSRGPNTLTVQVLNAAGVPVDGFAAPEVSVRSGQVDLGQVAVVRTAAGTYLAEVVFPSAGMWEVQVSVRETKFDNPVTTLSVYIR